MVQRTPGRFPYFQDEHNGVNGDTIRSDAENPGLEANTVSALASQLEGDGKKVGTQLSGEITDVVQKKPTEVAASARSLAAKAWFAVGLMNEFALKVDMFDTSTNECNVGYNTAVESARTKHKDDPATYSATWLDAQVDAAFQTWNPTYKNAVTFLDDGTDSIVDSFNNPGDLEKVRELIVGGLIPLSAAVLYPDLKLTTNNLVNAVLSGDYPPNVKTLMTNAAATQMPADVANLYLQKLLTMSPSDVDRLLPENFVDAGLEQPDATTCGSSTLVMAQMLNHPAYAMKILTGYNPENGENWEAPADQTNPSQWRFQQDSVSMHHRTNGGFLGWPEAWGTHPNDLREQMNNGSGRDGTEYTTYDSSHDPDTVYTAMQNAANSGHPVPVYVGSDWLPRHVVLVVGTDGDDLSVYDPSAGGTITVTREQWNDEEGNLGGNWNKRWYSVMPTN